MQEMEKEIEEAELYNYNAMKEIETNIEEAERG